MSGVQQIDGGLKTLLWATVQLDHLAAERAQDVPVGGIAWPGQRHPISGIKRGHEGQHKCTRGTSGHADVGGIDAYVVPAPVVTCNLLPKRADAKRFGIAESNVLGHQLDDTTSYVGGRALRWLAGTERDHVLAGGPQLGHPIEDRHHCERWDARPM